MGSVPSAGRAFFPLDEELELLPGALTPSMQEDLVRLAAWMPFEKASEQLRRFRGTQVSRSTAERKRLERPMWRCKRPRWCASSGSH